MCVIDFCLSFITSITLLIYKSWINVVFENDMIKIFKNIEGNTIFISVKFYFNILKQKYFLYKE